MNKALTVIATKTPKASQASQTRSSVLQLIGLMLLAKLAVDVVDAVTTEWVMDGARYALAVLLSLPTLALLGSIVMLSRRSAADPHTIKRFLVITMAAIALQIVLRSAVISMLANVVSPEKRFLIQPLRGSELSHSHTHLLTGVLFLMIPAVIGAWVSGRRGIWGWALLGIVISGTAIFIVNESNLTLMDLLPFITEDVALVLLTLFVGALADQERDEQARLQAANRRLAERSKMSEQLATSRERMRIARDLHDTVAHSLAGLIFQLDAMGTMMGDAPESTQQMLTRTKNIARQGLKDARAAITNLRAGLVEDSGLIGALQQHVESINSLGRVPIIFEHSHDDDIDPSLDQLSNAQTDALFRIAQEAIYNAARYAQARCIQVQLCQEQIVELRQTYLTLNIIDDGIGFEESAIQNGHYGLRGMRERAEEAGAYLRIDSTKGHGTTLSVTLLFAT